MIHRYHVFLDVINGIPQRELEGSGSQGQWDAFARALRKYFENDCLAHPASVSVTGSGNVGAQQQQPGPGGLYPTQVQPAGGVQGQGYPGQQQAQGANVNPQMPSYRTAVQEGQIRAPVGELNRAGPGGYQQQGGALGAARPGLTMADFVQIDQYIFKNTHNYRV